MALGGHYLGGQRDCRDLGLRDSVCGHRATGAVLLPQHNPSYPDSQGKL